MRVSLSPFDLRNRTKSPNWNWDFVPFIATLLIGIMFVLLGSKFILYPGIPIELPAIQESEEFYLEGVPCTTELTLHDDQIVLFEGRIQSISKLEVTLKAFIDSCKEKEKTLLIRADHHVKMETFLSICHQAKKAGFKSLQIAATSETLPYNKN
ncbi:MAG: hypothetical protein A2007_02605 [Verrucomicrobia bacterium GWC2_42_7]|nr:MAG: hypothetical protein A2007_02605 [Verrucomicrobia bacterium GWC2_42_7]